MLPARQKTFRDNARREIILLLVLVSASLLLMPIVIYLVGAEIFGDYAGNGFVDFYRDIYSDLRDTQTVVMFLLLSPYLIWQLLRLTLHLFRRMTPPDKQSPANQPAAGNGTGPM